MAARLRISGGELGGRRLESPVQRSMQGGDVRPTTERVREAVFSILGVIAGARVLDLCCGTGALGLEAISRGAAEATLVDIDTGLAERNVATLGLESRANVVRSDAVSFLDGAPANAFDLVLCDPPYGLAERIASELDPLLDRALAPGGRVMLESAAGTSIELGEAFELVRERVYGESMVRVLRKPDVP